MIITLYSIVAFALLSIFRYLSDNLVSVYFVVYTAFEYIFFSLLILTALKSRKIRLIIFSYSIIFLLFQIIFGLTSHRLDSISIGIETILIFISIFLFFYDHSQSNKAGYIYNHPVFWLSVGMLLYLGGTFFINILVNYMSKDEYENYWHLTYFAEIIKNILFAVSILIPSHQYKLNPINSSNLPYLDMDMN